MKTQMMQFRVTDEEKDLIEKCAKKARMTVSEYIRACMLMEMVVDGEMQALRIVGRTIGMKAMDALSRRLKAKKKLHRRTEEARCRVRREPDRQKPPSGKTGAHIS